MSLKRRYACIHIPSSTTDMLYFELTLHNKDLNNIVLQLNKEFNLNFVICKSYIDDKFGILLLDGTLDKNINIASEEIVGNVIFITHSSNLDEYVKRNDLLKDSTNSQQIVSLCSDFIATKLIL
jgi:hypothetical protein